MCVAICMFSPFGVWKGMDSSVSHGRERVLLVAVS